MPLPERRAEAGPWLIPELEQAIADVKAQFKFVKDQDVHMRVGLYLAGDEAHVVDRDDPELSVRVNPRFLLDGLGRWPATIYWSDSTFTHYVVVETDAARYYIALLR